MKRALVTGITGQDGYYLALELAEHGYEVYGLVRGQQNPKLLQLKQELPFVNVLHGDLLDRHSLQRAVATAQPNYVFNLGAITYIPFSWQQPNLVYDVDFYGVSNLLSVLEDYDKADCLVQASTSEMYGAPNGGNNNGLDEYSPLNPISPYAIAKTAAHHLVKAYNKAGKVRGISAVMFNHESPRRPENFVTRKITASLARIVRGEQEALYLGSGDAMRDWGYAPEYMQALRIMAERAGGDHYVVATGYTAAVREFAFEAADVAGVSRDLIHFEAPADIRVNDVSWLRGNAGRLRVDLGWYAQTNWRMLARMMMRADLQEK